MYFLKKYAAVTVRFSAKVISEYIQWNFDEGKKYFKEIDYQSLSTSLLQNSNYAK